jgi:hypothetical protein
MTEFNMIGHLIVPKELKGLLMVEYPRELTNSTTGRITTTEQSNSEDINILKSILIAHTKGRYRYRPLQALK